jgi:hypothetical protein
VGSEAHSDIASLGSHSILASRGVKLMVCKSCRSENQRKFNSEINVHLSGLKNLDKPPVFVFPRLSVCLDCGFAEFAIPENALCLLGKDPNTGGTVASSAHAWGSDLSEFAAGLSIRDVELETNEGAADKPLAMKNGFYRN